MKTCAKCGVSKEPSEFHRARNRPDGLYNYCKQCNRPLSREFYHRTREARLRYHAERRKRPEVIAARRRRNVAHYQANRDTELAHAKAWARNNRDRRRAYIKVWNEKNRAKVREYQERYKRLKRGATEHTLTVETWRLLQAVFRDKCVYCGKNPGKEQDHMTPLSKGGAHAHGNVVPACRHCNATKAAGATPPFWWAA